MTDFIDLDQKGSVQTPPLDSGNRAAETMEIAADDSAAAAVEADSDIDLSGYQETNEELEALAAEMAEPDDSIATAGRIGPAGETAEEAVQPTDGADADLLSAAGDNLSALDDDEMEVIESAAMDAEYSPDGSEDMAEEGAGEVAAGSATKGKKVSAAKRTGTGSGKKHHLFIAGVGLLLAAGFAIWGPGIWSRSGATRTQSSPPAEAIRPVQEAPPAEQPPTIAAPAPDAPYQETLREVAGLRAELIAKKEEIDQLKQFYRDGISELEEEVSQTATRVGIEEFSRAIANRGIELDLRSIQRRWAYIDALEQPSQWLRQGDEELLFLSRRATIDLQMEPIAGGVEPTRHLRHMNAALQKYRLAPDRLAIDPTSTSPRPLEQIWREIIAQNRTMAKSSLANGDAAIFEEICNGGDTGRASELTTLTIRAAKCLALTHASELFLNNLRAISPVAAKYLTGWDGNWLCLNGFSRLPPDVARHLFAWRGDWISLNGLETFPAETGEMLLAWEGRQLELMGLEYDPRLPQQIGLQQLARWEKSGGKLFVPEIIRAEINKIQF